MRTWDVEALYDFELDQDDMDVEEGMPGWFWFTAFGLLDSDDITPESMKIINRVA